MAGINGPVHENRCGPTHSLHTDLSSVDRHKAPAINLAYVVHLWQAARNLEQLNESVKSRHEQITKGLYATRIPGLESVPSNHLMLGHAANPTGTKMRPADKFRKRRSASAMQ